MGLASSQKQEESRALSLHYVKTQGERAVHKPGELLPGVDLSGTLIWDALTSKMEKSLSVV